MITKVDRKSMVINESGRSSDFITPSFGFGCLYKCAYCYMRRHQPNGVSIAKNVTEILTAINNHSIFLPEKSEAINNSTGIKKQSLLQTSPKYWTYDISCNEDFALHAKHHQWERIFDFFKNDQRILGTFATKYVNDKLLDYNSNKKIRIRFSLMPEKYRQILEPNTSTIQKRVVAVNRFIEAGYQVHLNFSPVIVHPGSGPLYKELFKFVDKSIHNEYKCEVKSEVIFLTHHQIMHDLNLEENSEAEKLLWKPELQEFKTTSYGNKQVLRYKWQNKKKYIEQFKKFHSSIIPWNTIRYCFIFLLFLYLNI